MPKRISASTLRGTSEKFKREEVFLLVSEPTDNLIAVNPHQQEMKDYLRQLDDAKMLMASGPLLSEGGEFHDGAYLSIIDVPGIEEAEDIAKRDPWVKRGLRKIDVRPMLVGHGSLYDMLKNR